MLLIAVSIENLLILLILLLIFISDFCQDDSERFPEDKAPADLKTWNKDAGEILPELSKTEVIKLTKESVATQKLNSHYNTSNRTIRSLVHVKHRDYVSKE